MPHTPGEAVLCKAQTDGQRGTSLGHQNTYIGDPAKPRSAGPTHQEAGKTEEEKLEMKAESGSSWEELWSH